MKRFVKMVIGAGKNSQLQVATKEIRSSNLLRIKPASIFRYQFKILIDLLNSDF